MLLVYQICSQIELKSVAHRYPMKYIFNSCMNPKNWIFFAGNCIICRENKKIHDGSNFGIIT